MKPRSCLSVDFFSGKKKPRDRQQSIVRHRPTVFGLNDNRGPIMDSAIDLVKLRQFHVEMSRNRFS